MFVAKFADQEVYDQADVLEVDDRDIWQKIRAGVYGMVETKAVREAHLVSCWHVLQDEL